MRQRSVFAGAALAVAAFSGAVLAQPKPSPQSAPAPVQASAAREGIIQRGRYLVEAGDCVACHTEQGGARMAGGRAVPTPFGTLLAPNITPDSDTGIGRWSADDFYRALHEGKDREGRHLYPAFPYNYYTKVTREDADAMFAYLQSVPAVRHEVHSNQLPFPFNIRALMVVWNWLFFDEGTYRPDAEKPAQWNRGAYLVQGLGHCAACHTPKNFLGGPKDDRAFQGGHFAEWFAPDITANRRFGVGAWSDEALREFLHDGHNEHSLASGEMGEVVTFSTSQLDDVDLAAVVAYVRSLPPSPAIRTSAPDPAVMRQGEAIWQDACSACHRMDGSGVPKYFPPLKANSNVQQSDPTTLLHFVLAGTRHWPTQGAPTPLSMPAFDWKLDDAQVAAVVTYVRNSWGNAAPPVSADQVADLRQALRHGEGRSHPQGSPALPEAAQKAGGSMANPGVNTLAPAGTDSRGNGTAAAARAAPSPDTISTAAASHGGASAAQSGQNGQGHPAGVPVDTPKPGKSGRPMGGSTGGPG